MEVEINDIFTIFTIFLIDWKSKKPEKLERNQKNQVEITEIKSKIRNLVQTFFRVICPSRLTTTYWILLKL